MMKGYRIVDLSLPIMNGGGFTRPAQITYIDHRTRAKIFAENFGIGTEGMGGKSNASEDFAYLNCHTGTHFDSPWHYVETVDGKPAMTIDEVPLEWCFGDGAWLDLSWKKPGDDITDIDVQQAAGKIEYTIKPMDIVLIKTGASAYYSQPGCDSMNAGMTREATLWLADQGIKVVGTDAGIWDRPHQMQLDDVKKGTRPGKYMQGHRAAGERGMCILEWLTNLDLLPHSGFTVYAFPVKVAKGSAGWVRVVAFVKE
ncbi:cyclase family protein [Chloroflexota bacterium]